MKLTEKKVHELIYFINHEISEYNELIDAGYKNYDVRKYTLQDVLDYVKDLFDVKSNNDTE